MKAALAALVLAGCNQVFGIKDTAPQPGADFDRDGIPDTEDNCPLAANPDQADVDHDGFGDACDPCPMGPQSGSDADHDGVDDACDVCLTGPNHEEDGDGFLDGCDVCPGDVDPDQSDKDGDGIGDACDPDDTAPRPQHRTFFDGFDPPAPGWQFAFEHWVDAAGSMGPEVTPLQAFEGPWNPAAMVDGTDWLVATLVEPPTDPAEGNVIGVFVYDEQGANRVACSVVWTNGGWIQTGTATAIPVGPTLRVAMFARPAASGSSIYCSFDRGVPSLVGSVTPVAFYPALTGVAKTRFHWFDVAR